VVTEFVFATAQYESGDWDSAPLVPANLIDSVARYTSLTVAPTGSVRFTDAERANVRRFVDRGGMLFVDDHNHDIDGSRTRTRSTRRSSSFPTVRLTRRTS
jgi:hypothetical protein